MSKNMNKYAPEVRDRAVRMVLDHERDRASRWTAVVSIAAKIGWSAKTLHDWVKKAEVDAGGRAGVTTEVAAKLKALERENRELRQANESLRKASAIVYALPRNCGTKFSDTPAPAPLKFRLHLADAVASGVGKLLNSVNRLDGLAGP